MNCFKNHLLTDSIILLIGNKSDLADKREVTKHEAQEYSLIYGCVSVEVSAKTAELINGIFYELINEIMCRMGQRAIPKTLRNSFSSIISLPIEKSINTSTLLRLSACVTQRYSNLVDIQSTSFLINRTFKSKNNEFENQKLIDDVILSLILYIKKK